MHRNVVHKSGFRTGTTTGEIVLPYVGTYSDILWPIKAIGVPTDTVTVWFTGLVRVAHAGWGYGDSGGPVFAREVSGGPYFALGIQHAGEGSINTSTGICNAGTGCAFFFVPWGQIEGEYVNAFNPKTTP